MGLDMYLEGERYYSNISNNASLSNEEKKNI